MDCPEARRSVDEFKNVYHQPQPSLQGNLTVQRHGKDRAGASAYTVGRHQHAEPAHRQQLKQLGFPSPQAPNVRAMLEGRRQ